MAIKRPQGNKWLTNSYSGFVPTKVGDTVEEMKFAYANQSAKYDVGKTEFQKKRAFLDTIKVAPGNKEFFDESVENYNEQYRNAEEKGDFENMVYDAGDIVSQISSDYKYKKLQEDHALYSADYERTEEAESPQEFKSYIYATNEADNQEGRTDSEGNLIYNKYVPMKDLSYLPSGEDVKDFVKDMEANGIIQRTDDGRIKVIGDIPGREGILKQTYLTKEDITAIGIDFLTNSVEHRNSINNEAEVAIGSIFLHNPSITLDELMPIIVEENPHKEDTPEYVKYIKDRKALILDNVEKRRVAAGSEKFDEQLALKEAVTSSKAEDILNNYAKTAGKLLATYDEDITTWATKKEDKDKSGGTTLEDINGAGVFNNKDLFVSNTETQSNLVQRGKAEIAKKMDIVKSNQLKLADLKKENEESKSKFPPHSDSELNKLEVIIETEQAKIEYISKKIVHTAEGIYNILKKKGVVNVDIEESIEKGYKAHKQSNPFNNISKEEYETQYKEGLIEEYDNPSILKKHPLTEGIKKHRETIKENVFNRTFTAYGVDTSEESAKDKKWLNEWREVKSIAKDDVLNNMAHFNGLVASMPEFEKEMLANGITPKDVIFEFSDDPDFAGNLVGNLSYNKTTGTGEKAKTSKGNITFSMLEGTPATTQINKLVKQAIGNINDKMLPYYDYLQPDKKEMVEKGLLMTTTLDGTLKRFNGLNIRASVKGDVKPFDLSGEHYEFITTADPNGNNEYLITKLGESSNAALKGVIQKGQMIKGWLHEDWDYKKGLPIRENGQLLKAGWYAQDDTIEILNGVIGTKNGFQPQKYQMASDVLNDITLDAALSTGNMDKFAMTSEQLHKEPKAFREDKLEISTENGLNTIDRTLTRNAQNNKYTVEQGYYPLTAITGSSTFISKNAEAPYVRFSERGVGLIAGAYNYIVNTSGGSLFPVFTGGYRTEAKNKEVEGHLNSGHKIGKDTDVLYDQAGKAFIDHLLENKEYYEVISAAPSKDDGIWHISFKSSILK